MTTLAFVYLARDAGPTFADLAGDIASLARPGDRVLIVDDGDDGDTPARIGRFTAQAGWGDGVAVTRIITGTRGAGDLGVAMNIALAELARWGSGLRSPLASHAAIPPGAAGEPAITGDPGADDQRARDPGADDPGAGDQRAGDPGARKLGARDPGAGDPGVAINIALAERARMRSPAARAGPARADHSADHGADHGAAPATARAVFLAAGSRIDPAAFAAARAQAETCDLDLLVLPWRQWSLDLGTVIDPPAAAAWAARPGESARDHALRLAPGLPGMLVSLPLLAGLWADEGRGSHGDLALAWQVLDRAGRLAVHATPPGDPLEHSLGHSLEHPLGHSLGHVPHPPDPGPALITALADLIAAQPGAAPWAAARLPRMLAGIAPGATGAVLTLGLASLAGRQDMPAGLLRALAQGDRTGARAALSAVPPTSCIPAPLFLFENIPAQGSHPHPAPAVSRNAPLRLHLAGAHARRMPFSYPAFAPLWADWAVLTDDPATADLILWANPRDLRAITAAQAMARAPQALLSEEPFWDTLFSPDPLARAITLEVPFRGALRLAQVNHHRGALFAFDRIPYVLLTDPAYASRYAALFTRNAARTADDWAIAFADRPLQAAFMAERRPEAFHDLTIPAGDIIGLCAWRTRLAEGYQTGQVARIGASWGTGPSRFDLDDWHAAKIAQLDGQARVISALENTHQPTYLSEKLFDAFACGARPLYLASPGHRIHDLGLPDGSWLNLWGADSAGAAALIDAAPWDDTFYAAYAQAQAMLATLWTDPGVIAVERARVGVALRAETQRLAGVG